MRVYLAYLYIGECYELEERLVGIFSSKKKVIEYVKKQNDELNKLEINSVEYGKRKYDYEFLDELNCKNKVFILPGGCCYKFSKAAHTIDIPNIIIRKELIYISSTSGSNNNNNG